MPKPKLPLVLALLLCPALASAAPVPPRYQGKLESCRVPNLDEEVLCGRHSVWEDRTARAGRKIDLYVVVVPALRPDPAPDPVFFLEGGPGDPATNAVPDLAKLLYEMRRNRDLVFVDLRGMGKSGVLACRLPGSEDEPQGYLREMFPLEPLRACVAELSRKADLRQYTNVQAMDDLDEVRAWLGYERINLWGASYGTRSAQVYMKRHPQRVRSAVLEVLVPLDWSSPLTYARSSQTALDRVFDDCGADESCRRAFPNLRAELSAVLERLDRAPGEATVPHPKTGQPVELSIPRTSFTTTLRSLQYSPSGYVRIPLIIHRAYEGDFGPIIREALMRGRPADWMGSFFSITCPEDVARIDPARIQEQVEGTFVGDDRIRQQRAVCRVWPKAELPADFWEPVRSPVPVLALNGWLDPVTPPELASSALRHLPNHAHVVVRDAAHGAFGLSDGMCYFDIVTQFIRDGSPYGLDTSCTRRMKRQPFVLQQEAQGQ